MSSPWQSVRDEPIRSCDTAVALSDTTASGGVLLAKNSDRPSHEAQRLIGVPATLHEGGATAHCQYITVPQVTRTAALIGSQPYWLWGFEHGMNAYGVAIGNEAIHTRELPQESGLLGMDLVRLGLERGTSARHALDVITTLLEEFGQGGSAAHHKAHHYYNNSFLIADPREAWVLETSARRWVARRLTRGTYAISNRPTIGTDYDLASADLITYAEERGWWPRGRRPFDFAAAYTNPDHPILAGVSRRLARSSCHLATSRHTTLNATAMMALLRDHGPDPAGGSALLPWPADGDAGPLCVHGPADGGSTAASMVAHLMPSSTPMYWASMAPPCIGTFLPCWVDIGPPAALAEADEMPAETSPWWRFRRLWEAVAAVPDPAALVAQTRRTWQPLEERLRDAVAALGPDAPAETRRAVSDEAFAAALQVLARLEEEIVACQIS